LPRGFGFGVGFGVGIDVGNMKRQDHQRSSGIGTSQAH
jgi:hypothetical protein